ncbi:MAG TPA: hypothetical protein VHG32_06560 [Thermoanaerobaculia bacterium]|nr:hypothetical protein [Thermoanaerobaculia bacterium]
MAAIGAIGNEPNRSPSRETLVPRAFVSARAHLPHAAASPPDRRSRQPDRRSQRTSRGEGGAPLAATPRCSRWCHGLLAAASSGLRRGSPATLGDARRQRARAPRAAAIAARARPPIVVRALASLAQNACPMGLCSHPPRSFATAARPPAAPAGTGLNAAGGPLHKPLVSGTKG